MLWLLVALLVLNLAEGFGIGFALYFSRRAARDLEDGLADSIARIDDDVKTIKHRLLRGGIGE